MRLSKTVQVAFGVVTLLHFVVFIKYPFDPHPNTITMLGEVMKTAIPFFLLATLIPSVSSFLDKLLHRDIVNSVSLFVVVGCLANQIVDAPGQAWSTVAFATLLILLTYNYLIGRHELGSTNALVLSFMSAWFGWVVFETLFHTGLWIYHPSVYNGDGLSLFASYKTMVLWSIAPLSYISFQVWYNKMHIRISKTFIVLCVLGTAATIAWFTTGMLIPLPVGPDGLSYRPPIDYFSLEHFEFSVSRLSQISIMCASVALFVKGGRKCSN